MNSGKDRPIGKMHYEKPTAVDLGPAAPVVGGSCVSGESYGANGFCYFYGNHADSGCEITGNHADGGCAGYGNYAEGTGCTVGGHGSVGP